MQGWFFGERATLQFSRSDTLVDKVSVTIVYPPIYIYLMFVISLLLLSPYVLAKERLMIKKEWQINKVPILIVGFLDLFAYMMILFALRISKVSYVAAAREVGIVFSVLIGIMLLKEKNAPQKLAGAILITLGVIFIGLGSDPRGRSETVSGHDFIDFLTSVPTG